ncbi:MAG: transmembrane family protein, partial [Micavibrio aeruginosavorus]
SRVDITTGFNGTSVIMFGTIKGGEAGLAVTLKGPERTIVIRKKEKTAGTWMNRGSVEFRRVPSYYDYALNLTGAGDTAALFGDNQIGVDYLAFYPEDADEDPAIVESFSDALIRNMQEKGFYPLKPKVPQMLGDGFFKVSFDLPPGVPTGIYTVEAMAVRDGVVAARESKTLQVGQVGFNARVYLFAENHSLFYGIASVLIALVSGWAAFTFLRRD